MAAMAVPLSHFRRNVLLRHLSGHPYFGITPYSTYEMLYFPVFLRGLGMMTLFIAFGVYVVEDLDPKLMLSNAFFLISLRSVLAPAISASFSVTCSITYKLRG